MKALQFNVNAAKFVAAKSLKTVFGNRIFYQGPLRTIRLTDIAEPALPSQDWVKVKTLYCGFCGSDLNLILLRDSPTASPFTSFPCITGHEIVGEIVETGARVPAFEPGDIVSINPALGCEARGISPPCSSCQTGRSTTCENFAEGSLPPGLFTGITSGINGGFAPFVAAHKCQLFKVPAGLSLESAVMTEPLSVALQTLFDNMVLENEKILVIGGGVIGNLIIQSARAFAPGCHISVLDPSPFAADLAAKMGADEILPFKKIFPYAAKITGSTIYKPMIGTEITMGGFDRIYDTVAHSSTLNLSMRLLSAMGTLSVVGIGGNVNLDLTPLWLKLQTVKGVYGYGKVKYNGESRHVFEVALEMMLEGKIRADILVTHKFRIEDFPEMIEVNMNKGKHKAMKTVVSFT